MRARNKKHLEERFEKCRYLTVEDPAAVKGRWHTVFGDESKPVHLEIGCGKGAFVTGMAAAHPEINFIAMECVKNVIVSAMEKTELSGLQNIRFIHGNADELASIFDAGEISRIYLNFSDPWPRKKQFKHRLTYAAYLNLYKIILPPNGSIIQKTDNRDLFDYSVQSFTENGWRIANVSYNLHSDETPPEILRDNIITEYESRFMEAGQPIYRLEAYKN